MTTHVQHSVNSRVKSNAKSSTRDVPVEKISNATASAASTESTVTKKSTPSVLGYDTEIRTVQAITFKVLIESVKELLPDCNIEFSPSGIKILSMDPTHTVLVHIQLDADNFEHYYCPERKLLGVSMINLFKLIKGITTHDTLCLFTEKEYPNHLGIHIENSTKNSSTIFKLNLMDLSEEALQVPPASFPSVVTIRSTEFQKLMRDMSAISDVLEIQTIEGEIILSAVGDFASQRTVLGESKSNGITVSHSSDKHDIVQGFFSLKHLLLFCRCTSLCSSMRIFLRNSYPAVLQYYVGSIGVIKLCLAPKSVGNASSSSLSTHDLRETRSSACMM